MKKRSAFSLMEMLLALAIAMVLMLALYLTLSAQFIHIRDGRDVVAEGALARNILNTIANDISGQLGLQSAPIDPSKVPAEFVTFNLGVQGDGTYLTLSATRVQKPRKSEPSDDASLAPTGTDLRRVSYWIVNSGDGEETSGLARYESKQCTQVDLDTLPTDLPEQNKYIIAKEVKAITFEYHDGLGWLGEGASWSGLEPATEDGKDFLGPPAAIKITITLRAPDNQDGLRYSHVIALPGSNNFPKE